MTEQEMTVREVCDALGVSRAMVQKLEAAGELRRLRPTGRVVFDRARVEQLREERDISREQRRQEREEQALRGEAAEDQHHQVEFAAWAKSATEKRELETIHQELSKLRADLNDLREEQRRQAWASRMDALTRRNERRTVERDSEPAAATLGLLSLGAMALIVHAARDGNDPAGTARGADYASRAKSEAPGAQGERGDTTPSTADEDDEEKRLLEKIRAQTATPEELEALVAILWRGRPPRSDSDADSGTHVAGSSPTSDQ